MKNRNIIISGVFISIIVITLILTLSPPVNTVKIGFIADLTGRQSQLGVTVRNGFLMAVNELNAAGGINGLQIVPIIKNNENDIITCETRTKELIEEGVAAIIGPMTSSMVIPVLNASGNTPVISPTVSTDTVTGRDDMFFSVIPAASMQGKALAEALINNEEKEIAIILDERNIEYTGAFTKGFTEKYIGETNRTPQIFSFTDKTQFPGLTESLLKLNPGALVFVCSGVDAAGIIQKFAKKSPLPPLYSSYWGKASNVHEYGGKTVEGMIIIAGYENQIPTEKEKLFYKNYADLYNINPNFAARYSYESLMLYAEAAETGKSFKSETIKREIINIKQFEGITDSYSLDNFGDVIRDQTLFIIENNKYEYY